jgi:hypothetical protein
MQTGDRLRLFIVNANYFFKFLSPGFLFLSCNFQSKFRPSDVCIFNFFFSPHFNLNISQIIANGLVLNENTLYIFACLEFVQNFEYTPALTDR